MNFIVFACIVFVLLLIDLLTKELIFEWDEKKEMGIHQYDGNKTENWLFGIKSVSNNGLTFMPSWVPIGVVHFFNFIILFCCLGSLIFFNHWLLPIFIAFIFAGSLGNMIDRFAFGKVRDIIYLPWWQNGRGVFNFADVDAVIGAIGLAITIIFQVLFGSKNDRKIKKLRKQREQDIKTQVNDEEKPKNNEPLIIKY